MGSDPLWGEEMSGGDSPEKAPIRAIRSEANGSAEHEALGGLLHRTVSEVGRRKDLAGNVRVGGDGGWDGAQAESHELFGG